MNFSEILKRTALALVVCLFLAAAAPVPGMKFVMLYSSPGWIGNEVTLNLQSDRRRWELRISDGGKGKPNGTTQVTYRPPLVAIDRCDMGQAFGLDLEKREYTVAPYPPPPPKRDIYLASEQEKMDLHDVTRERPDLASVPPRVKQEITTVDTKERKPFFGHTARHVITTRRETPLEGSPSYPSETVIDGWYIDLNTRIACDGKYPAGMFVAPGNTPVLSSAVIHGNAETGFPVDVKTTTRTTVPFPDGNTKEFTTVNFLRVTRLEEKPLDPALFEVPPGFRKKELYGSRPSSSLSTWAAIKQWFSNVVR